jgi:undecaprenyl pyrophosphate phosphatase UppP
MYHWSLLLTSSHGDSPKKGSSAVLPFFDHDDPFTASLNHAERQRLLWFGAIEFLPVLLGCMAAYYVDSGLVQTGFIVAGLVICGLTCWLLRRKTPATRIHLSDGETDNEHSRNA